MLRLALLNRCIAGDEKSWNELIDIITPLILSLCRKNNLSREESCDVFGQVSYKLLNNLKKLKSADKFMQYVRSMTINEIMNIYRKNKLDQKTAEYVYDSLYNSRPATPEEMYDYSLKIEKLMNALVKLPDREYLLLRALFLEKQETSYKEISDRLGIPVASIGPMRARGLSKLCKILKGQKKDS